MIQTENFQKVEVASPQELRNWLERPYLQQESVRLVTFKKSVPDKYLSISGVLEELICFGWIDGIRRKLDDQRTLQFISPRKVEHWAKSYKDRAAKKAGSRIFINKFLIIFGVGNLKKHKTF